MCMNEVAEQPCGQKMAVEAGQNFLRELVWPLGMSLLGIMSDKMSTSSLYI